MLILIFIFCILLCIAPIALGPEYEELAVFPFLLTIVSIIGIVWCSTNVIDGRNLQAKIDMYEEENQKIENDISIMVKQYMEHEDKVIDEVSGENAITLVNLYPDLKSSELVMEEIQLHTSNNATIKKLKEKQIDVRTYKWWLYFGGK